MRLTLLSICVTPGNSTEARKNDLGAFENAALLNL